MDHLPSPSDGVSRRMVLRSAMAMAVAAGALSGCSGGREAGVGNVDPAAAEVDERSAARAIGDGSTSDTGPQPHQPTWTALAAGEAPPQFVVYSWDGGADLPQGILNRFLSTASEVGAAMTIFLTGIYIIPDTKRTAYHPPGRPPGSSDVSFLDEAEARRTLTGIGQAWKEGHEIGTHFNGHFCGRKGGDAFSGSDWRQELSEAVRLVSSWRTVTGWTDLEPLPFDYTKELIGSRTPCLEGRKALLPVAREAGFRYESSGNREQTWPGQVHGMWDLSLQQVPFRRGHAMSMDYTYMFNQSGENVDAGTPAQRKRWRTEVTDSLMRGLDRALHGNRAPLVIGNHFEQWNGGIYMDAVETAMREMARHPGVRLVSMRQLCDWLDRQEPQVLSQLQKLPIGQAPREGWSSITTPTTETSSTTPQDAVAKT